MKLAQPGGSGTSSGKWPMSSDRRDPRQRTVFHKSTGLSRLYAKTTFPHLPHSTLGRNVANYRSPIPTLFRLPPGSNAVRHGDAGDARLNIPFNAATGIFRKSLRRRQPVAFKALGESA